MVSFWPNYGPSPSFFNFFTGIAVVFYDTWTLSPRKLHSIYDLAQQTKFVLLSASIALHYGSKPFKGLFYLVIASSSWVKFRKKEAILRVFRGNSFGLFSVLTFVLLLHWFHKSCIQITSKLIVFSPKKCSLSSYCFYYNLDLSYVEYSLTLWIHLTLEPSVCEDHQPWDHVRHHVFR